MQLIRFNNRGFTLIEIMVVLIIMGTLAGLLVARVVGRPEEARQVKAKVLIEGLDTALKLYKLDNGMYPDTTQGLQALVEKPETEPIPKKWRKGGYLEKSKVPLDPWGSEFIYLAPGVHGDFDIISYGADGVLGGKDKDKDINNWETE